MLGGKTHTYLHRQVRRSSYCIHHQIRKNNLVLQFPMIISPNGSKETFIYMCEYDFQMLYCYKSSNIRSALDSFYSIQTAILK